MTWAPNSINTAQVVHLVDEVAGGSMDLHPVKARLDGVLGSLGVLLHHACDLLLLQRAGDGVFGELVLGRDRLPWIADRDSGARDGCSAARLKVCGGVVVVIISEGVR
jgi:hypothetical protein